MTRDTLDYRFDQRVADQYDALRGHPPAVARQVGVALAAALGGCGHVLEPGVGTGRIALPLIEAGCEVTGVDLSADMLAALAGHALPRLHLVRGDITRLPFAPASFDAAVCVHVLHLVDSRTVLQSLLRLLRPGGSILLGRDWVDPDSFAGQLRNAFRQAVVDLADSVDFPTGARGLVQQALELGAEPVAEGTEETAVEWQTPLSPRQVLEGIRSRDDAESWVLPDTLLARVMARLDDFAAVHWPALDATQPVSRRFVFSRLRVPAATP